MKLSEVAKCLDAKVYTGECMMDMDVQSACGADLMSDVMAFVKDNVVLLTGLINAQTLRTAELMDIKAVVLVRGKNPTEEMVRMAIESGAVLMSTKNTMFIACGLLYAAGLRQHGVREIE